MASETDRFLQVTVPAGDDFFLINGFTCTESISQLFHVLG